MEGLIAGLELEMPSSGGIRDEDSGSCKSGKLSEEVLDMAVKDFLTLYSKPWTIRECIV